MKSLFRLSNLLLLAVAIFALSSCKEDEGPDPAIGPVIEFLAETGFIDIDSTLAGGALINVKIKASKGDNPLASVEFLQDGVRIGDASRITIDGAAASSAAPVLFDAEKDAFTWEVSIASHDSGAADYSFIVTDDAGGTSSAILTITIAENPPTLIATGGIVALAATAGGVTSIKLTATSPSGAALNTITVYENGAVAAGADRFWFGGIMAADAFEGTFTLAEGDQDGFDGKELLIRSNATSGTIDSYMVEVTDANGQTATLDITVEATGTDIEKTLTGILLNAGGPAGTGGLDLDDGNGDIGSNDASAEIKDEGIDNSQPNATNWKQQIAPVNGTELRYLAAADYPEGFSFASVTTTEAIEEAYNLGTTKAVSDVVLTGDVFIVYKASASRYYLLEVSNVNITDTDNKDSYTFNIKW